MVRFQATSALATLRLVVLLLLPEPLLLGTAQDSQTAKHGALVLVLVPLVDMPTETVPHMRIGVVLSLASLFNQCGATQVPGRHVHVLQATLSTVILQPAQSFKTQATWQSSKPCFLTATSRLAK